jgi:serine/threonine protein kinase
VDQFPQKPDSRDDLAVKTPSSSEIASSVSGGASSKTPSNPELFEKTVTAKADMTPATLVGTTIAGVTLTGRLGEGGMGVVYKGRHLALDTQVAMKLLPQSAGADPEFIARFFREARAIAKLDHPNILRVLNVGEEAGHFFIVMQYVEGHTLRELINDRGKLEPREASNIILDIAKGLKEAHRNSIVHRDIKPENIMIGASGVPKIVDFGLVRDINSGMEVTRFGQILGSPYYMSPEQCEGKVVDPRSDIYSLGVTFYHAVTGKRPFEGESVISIIRGHTDTKLTPPKSVASGVPAAISDIICKMMAKNPAQRYQTAEEVIAALQAALGQMPAVEVPKPGKAAKIAAVSLIFVALIAAALVLYLTRKKTANTAPARPPDVVADSGAQPNNDQPQPPDKPPDKPPDRDPVVTPPDKPDNPPVKPVLCRLEIRTKVAESSVSIYDPKGVRSRKPGRTRPARSFSRTCRWATTGSRRPNLRSSLPSRFPCR